MHKFNPNQHSPTECMSPPNLPWAVLEAKTRIYAAYTLQKLCHSADIVSNLFILGIFSVPEYPRSLFPVSTIHSRSEAVTTTLRNGCPPGAKRTQTETHRESERQTEQRATRQALSVKSYLQNSHMRCQVRDGRLQARISCEYGGTRTRAESVSCWYARVRILPCVVPCLLRQRRVCVCVCPRCRKFIGAVFWPKVTHVWLRLLGKVVRHSLIDVWRFKLCGEVA